MLVLTIDDYFFFFSWDRSFRCSVRCTAVSDRGPSYGDENKCRSSSFRSFATSLASFTTNPLQYTINHYSQAHSGTFRSFRRRFRGFPLGYWNVRLSVTMECWALQFSNDMPICGTRFSRTLLCYNRNNLLSDGSFCRRFSLLRNTVDESANVEHGSMNS